MGDDAHAERGGAASDLLADPSQPGEPQRLVAHLFAEKLLFLPLALLHGGVGGRQVARHRQHQADGQLGHADAVRARRVHDDDAAGAGGGDVDVVHAGAGAGDHPQARRGGDERRGHLCCASNDKCVGIGEIGGELSGVRPVRASTSHPSARSRSSAEDGRSSATMIFNGVCPRSKGTYRVGTGILGRPGDRDSESIICRSLATRVRRSASPDGGNSDRYVRIPSCLCLVGQGVEVRCVTVALRWCKPLKCSDRARFVAAAGSFQQGFQQKLCVTCGSSAGHRPKKTELENG